jgi:cytochrome c553
MWRSSKHGVIHHLEPDTGRAPVCQTCHMDAGNHAVRTGWGFLALRLPIRDKEWADAQMKVIRALGPWGQDEKGMTERIGAVKALDLARLTDEAFRNERRRMVAICGRCHSRNFAAEQLAAGDKLIRESTLIVAEAVDTVQALYDDGVLPARKDGSKRVDLLLFYESPTPIEQELYEMFLFHRQKVFQGVMHTNPDYAHWYGWAKMKSSLVKIRAMAAALRK